MQARFYEPKHKDGKILAFADVELDIGMTIRGFRVVNGVNGLFAGVPSRPTMVDGQTQYYNQIVFDTDKRRAEFLGELLREYEVWRQSSPQGASGVVRRQLARRLG